jgi:predicted aldo/keto reductase-like oxidoreductase
MLMFSVNPAFDMLPPSEYVFDHFEEDFGAGLFKGIDPRRAELYKLCSQKQIGVTVMKSLGAGKLLKPEFSPFAKPLTAAQCIHYALSRPSVASVLAGCQSPAEVAEAAGYFDLDDSRRDYAEVLGAVRNDFKGNCVYCGHCQPCPADIDIASVHQALDTARLDAARIPPSVRSHYAGLSRHGGDCLACGSCEERCPFGVPVTDHMKEAAELFGK